MLDKEFMYGWFLRFMAILLFVSTILFSVTSIVHLIEADWLRAVLVGMPAAAGWAFLWSAASDDINGRYY